MHYAYPEDCPEIYVGGETRTMRGVMEIGGLLVEVSAEEVRGRELSEILRGVDERVGRELEKVGWVDVVPRPGERGKVRLKLRVGKKEKVVEEREGKGENREDTSFESDEEEDLAEKGALG